MVPVVGDIKKAEANIKRSLEDPSACSSAVEVLKQLGEYVMQACESIPQPLLEHVGKVCGCPPWHSTTTWGVKYACLAQCCQVHKSVLMWHLTPTAPQAGQPAPPRLDQALHTDVDPKANDEPVAIMPLDGTVKVRCP